MSRTDAVGLWIYVTKLPGITQVEQRIQHLLCVLQAILQVFCAIMMNGAGFGLMPLSIPEG